jgi:hypothetical protein
MDFLIKKHEKELKTIFYILKRHYYSEGSDLISLVNSARGLSKKNRNDLWRLIELSKETLVEHDEEQEHEFSVLVKQLTNNLGLGIRPIFFTTFKVIAAIGFALLLAIYATSTSHEVFSLEGASSSLIMFLLILCFSLFVSTVAYVLVLSYRMVVMRFLNPIERPYTNKFEDTSFDSEFNSVNTCSVDSTKTKNTHNFNKQTFGQKFSSAKEAGLYGEMEIEFIIRTQTNERVLTPISTENLVLKGYNFEIDLLVPVSGVGLVLLEVKNYQGKLLCMSDDEWVQVKNNGERRSFKGATQQVSRTRKLLQKNLQECGLDAWDIIPVVVLANADTEVIRLDDRLSPCYAEIVRKQDIVTWLHNLPVNSQVKVTPDDATKIHMSLLSIQKEFQVRSNPV